MNRRFFDASVFVYCFLLIFSCLTGLYLDLTTFKAVGLLGLAWSIFAALVFIWVVERVYYFKKQAGATRQKKLPHQIINTMQRQRIYNQGIKAVRSYNSINLFILICGALYCGWMLWVAIHPEQHEGMARLKDMISGFFADEGLRPIAYFSFTPLLYAFVNIVDLLIVFIAFWMVQLYVYSNSQCWNIVWLALPLFFLSFFAMMGPGNLVHDLTMPVHIMKGYGWSNIEPLQSLGAIPDERLSYLQMRIYASGFAGATFFYLPGLVVALILIRNMFSKSLDKRLPFVGLFVLAIMLYVDIFYAAQPREFSLWLSGWCILGVVCIRERSGMRKIYRIHQ